MIVVCVICIDMSHCRNTRSDPFLLSQGVAGQSVHGLWQHLPRTGSRNTRPASSSLSPSASSSYNYFTLAGRQQVCQYLRNKYLRQKFLLLQLLSFLFLSIFHGPQSDTVEYKVVPMEAFQTTDTTTTWAGQCPPAIQEVESRPEAASLGLRSRGTALWRSAPGEGCPYTRTRCW